MAETKETKTTTEKENVKSSDREYTIPLREALNRIPRYKKANKAVKTIKEFLVRHMKVRDRDLNKVKIDKYLNEYIWSRGIRSPPAKIKVKVTMVGDIVNAELSEMSTGMKFKKEKFDKRNTKASESKTIKKPKAEVAEESKSEEEKKESDEKKASVVEAGKQMEKAAAKAMKHQPQDQKKKATTPRRMALKK